MKSHLDAAPDPVPFAATEKTVTPFMNAINGVVRGKPDVVRQAVVTLVAGGHLLIEDVPGVGKTTLAHAMARAMGGTFRRVQFTSDLLPADILGVNVFDPAAGTFQFRPGPVFCNVLLADEINRTTPRTQSALLQSMEEHRVTLDGVTHELADPFLVIATQNPLEHHGTYPLPESQMDRFLMRLSMGYPGRDAERELVSGGGASSDQIEEMDPVLGLPALLQARRQVGDVEIDPTLVDYLIQLVEATREHPDLTLGASPRASLALARAARASAFLDGRTYVVPDDIKSLVPPVLAHRLTPRGGGSDTAARLDQVAAVLADLLERIPVPL